MLSAFYMTKNIQIIIYYLIYMVKIQNGRQWTKMATKKMPTTFFLNNMTYFIKKMTLAKIYPKFSHIDTTAYTMKLPQEYDNELWREGFDWITLKVIVMVRKVRFGSFSHISLY